MSSAAPVSRRRFILGTVAVALVAPAATALLPSRANALGVRPGGFETWHEYPLATAGGSPGAILCDASDTVWYSDDLNNQLVRFPASAPASFRTIDLGPTTPIPGSLVAGSDGGIWFDILSEPALGRVDPSTGAVTLFPTGGADSVFSPALGADGRLWFGDPDGGGIGSMAPDGSVTRVADPAGSLVTHLVSAGDGRLWYTRDGIPVLVRYDPVSATFDELFLPGGDVYGLTVDAAGEVWASALGLVNHIDRADTVTSFAVPSTVPFWPGVPTNLVAGVHARLYFTDEQLGLGRIASDGTVTFQRPPYTAAAPRALTVDSTGTLWYTDPSRSTVGSL